MSDLAAVSAAVLVALVVARVLRRRRTASAPTQAGWQVPSQLDRGDFPRADAAWVVVAFTSSTCSTCADVAAKVAVLESREVAVARIDYSVDADLHRRYGIDAVPCVVVADSEGAVRQSFLGPVKAQDLWAAVAECREPGSTPEACEHHSGPAD